MTARIILITNRAQAMERIEKSLPPKFVETLSNRPEERLNAILDYLAAALEKSGKKKPADPPPPPPEDPPAPPAEDTPPPPAGEEGVQGTETAPTAESAPPLEPAVKPH